MTIAEKLSIYTPLFNNGDIVLIKGTGLLGRLINWGDDCYWNHALVVKRDGSDLFAIESENAGVTPDFLIQELKKVADFTILRPLFPQATIDKALEDAFKAGQGGIPYDVWALPKILLYVKLGIKSKVMSDYPHKEICSCFVAQQYGGRLPLTCYDDLIKNQGFITPQDMIRFIDKYQVQQLAPEKLD
jgi:hypothetical protein